MISSIVFNFLCLSVVWPALHVLQEGDGKASGKGGREAEQSTASESGESHSTGNHEGSWRLPNTRGGPLQLDKNAR